MVRPSSRQMAAQETPSSSASSTTLPSALSSSRFTVLDTLPRSAVLCLPGIENHVVSRPELGRKDPMELNALSPVPPARRG